MPILSAPTGLEAGEWPPSPVPVYAWRQQQLEALRASRDLLAGAKAYYRDNPVAFINHWCDTFDPRNASTDIPVRLPFQTFPRQADLVEFVYACITGQAGGLVEKCRGAGATWIACAVSVHLWLFWPGAAVGWGSRKEALVDKLGDMDSIFEKMRAIIDGLPREFWPKGFSQNDHLNHMRIVNPETGATITGEAGDNIGRGGRNLVYFKDESAHYERPEKIEASLSENTRCQIDISSVNGTGNVFYRRRDAGKDWQRGAGVESGCANVFVFDWRDVPWMTEEWYERRRAKFENDGLAHVFAQEVDRDYAASVEGIIIPPKWVKSAIDAHVKLGIEPTGPEIGALDVADGGNDKNATVWRRGIVIYNSDAWGARDTGVTTRRAVAAAPEGEASLQYDCIGVGAGVKAEANRLGDENLLPEGLSFTPWNAGAKVLNPDAHTIPGDKKAPLNKDHYANLKAQAWWQARLRFERTHRAVTEEGFTYDPEELVSIASDTPNLQSLVKELSQATAGQSANMKTMVNKTPEGTRSPNLADAAVMCLWPAIQTPDSTYTLDNL